MRFILFPILLPLSIVFTFLSFLRAKLYDVGVIESFSVNSKVICVGNLTSGGTGKTPIIRWLAQEISKRGKKVAVLSRGYKRNSEKILKVNPMSAEVAKFGDEPLQLAKQLKGISIYVGANRVQAARQIINEESPDVILMDDGFQHRRLRRDLDLVVMDATQPLWHYWPLPLGFGREGRWALKRAQAVVLTKSNLASVSDIEKLNLGGLKLLEFNSHIVRCRTLDGEIWNLERLRGEKVALLSAIGNPASFEKQVKSNGVEVVYHKIFPDHHRFRVWDINKFLAKAGKAGAAKTLVTEKDAVKLLEFNFPKDKVLIAELEVELKNGKEDFDRLISRLFS
jgi:tetraacyldisaccharide 4'-kinase